MTEILGKRPRIRVESQIYRELRTQVLQRDGWRCQRCGSFINLQVHHIRPRSRLGDDTEANLITLCAKCHRNFHRS
jgi:5-methylcytosine-specific restriction endonuclease McrA